MRTTTARHAYHAYTALAVLAVVSTMLLVGAARPTSEAFRLTVPTGPATAGQPGGTAGRPGATGTGRQPATAPRPPAAATLRFMASLQLPGRKIRHFCGGSLIAPTWVLTAAHCMYQHGRPIPASEFAVRIGSADSRRGGVYVRATHAYVPANYRDYQTRDIALLELERPVGLEPVPVTGTPPATGTQVRLPGWGQPCPTRDCGVPRRYLKQPESRVVKASTCRNRFDSTTELCVGIHSSETVCYGDSGGPALVSVAGRWQVVGVTSRIDNGATCGRGNAIYTDATAYLPWISQVTAGMGARSRSRR